MNKVYITGVGCITPLGNNVETLWNNVINGVCGIGLITKLDREAMPVKVAAEVKDFHPEDYGIDKTMIRHNDIYALYALAAAAQAMQDSGLRVGEDVDPTRFGTAIGSGDRRRARCCSPLYSFPRRPGGSGAPQGRSPFPARSPAWS